MSASHVTLTRDQYYDAIRRAKATALTDAAKDWAADPDAVGDSFADARNWLRDRAEEILDEETA